MYKNKHSLIQGKLQSVPYIFTLFGKALNKKAKQRL